MTGSDEDLLALYVQTNSTEYFGELYNRYILFIYGLFLKHFQNAEKAENAVMELFEFLLPEVSNCEIKVFKTWIYCQAKNFCLEMPRKDGQRFFADVDANIIEPDLILGMLEANGTKEEIEVLNHCIEKLPKPQRTTISMFFIEGMSYADIAEQTGYLLKSIKSHIQNGKRSLKTCIEKHQNK